jgi:hypothetical protein
VDLIIFGEKYYMKKIALLLLCLCSLQGFSQDEKPISGGKNELKGNALFLVLGFPEFTYERIFSNESSVGITTGFAIEEDFDQKFTLSPYYRYFFGKKTASGFFVEGFGMLNVYEEDYYYDFLSSNMGNHNRKNITDFALGFGLGAKWVTDKGFLFELNTGIGRNLFNTKDSDNNEFGRTFVGKFGITAGYRF